MDRAKLDSVIEREVHKLIREIAEHTYDFTNLYMRRTQPGVDLQQMESILQAAKLGIADGELSKIPFFHERIKKVLDEVVEEENPTQHIELPNQPPPVPGRKVSFSV